MLYICAKFREHLKEINSDSANTISLIFSKKCVSITNAGEVMVLILCTSSDGALYLYQVSRKYQISHRGTELLSSHHFPFQTFKRGIILSKTKMVL